MVLTINPADAQAMQEDEAQLLSAILQATRGAIAFLNQPQPPLTNEPPEAIRIQMGRRLVYGWMADGQFRNELDANKMQAIFDAIQRPVSEGVDPESYRGKVPAIEIRDGGTALFREERDGMVTVNAIQFQLEQETTQEKETQTPVSQPSLETPVELPKAETEQGPKTEPENLVETPSAKVEEVLMESLSAETESKTELEQETLQPNLSTVSIERASEVAQIADYLLNPLREESPLYDLVAVKGYQISRDGDDITISRENEPVLETSNGEITTNQLTRQDWETFQRLQPQPATQTDYQPNGKRLVESGVLDSDAIQHDMLDAQQNKRNGIWTNTIPLNQDSLTLTADVVDANEIKKTQIQDTPSARDTGSLTVDVAEATSDNQTLPAIAVLERETAKLPDGATQQLLQTTVQDWSQQVQGLQQGMRQGLGWLASRVEDWRHQQVARAALDLFNRGYERTGERAYQVGEYTVSFTGRNLYTLKDSQSELMQFQAFKSLIPGVKRQTIQVLSTDERLGSFQSKALQTMQQNKAFTPQGDLDVEAAYTAKTSQVEQIVTHFLQTKAQANIWDKEGGKFKLEIGEAGFIRITDKQEGRGVVFQRKDSKVSSKLGARDFAHFDRLASKMQQTQTSSQPQATNRSSAKPLGLELE